MPLSQHIEITEGTCSGRPRVAGTRIRVANIVLWHDQGQSPEEIAAAYPQLTLADVHAALAYCFDHRQEIEQQVREDAEYVEGLQSRMNSSA